MDWVCVLLVAVSVRYGAVCARALFVICCVLSVCCVYGCAVTCMCVCGLDESCAGAVRVLSASVVRSCLCCLTLTTDGDA